MSVLSNLEPKQVFHYFEEICKIPHGTFHTERISGYCVAFAKERGLKVIKDSTGNVIIKKEGTKGYEQSKPVIIQGHLDMVCEKAPGSSHDFLTHGLDLYIEDGYVKAKDTTLGGDDGIAVAMALALLDSDDIPHPPIETVFTVDEEVGMSGAMEIDLSVLEGKMLINIDSEEEGILTVGCAGGYRLDAEIPVERIEKTGVLAEMKVQGLKGGHSGVEIHKQRGNAHKIMARLLNRIRREIPMELVEIYGGSKDNVITVESTAEIMIEKGDTARVEAKAMEMMEICRQEFMGDEPLLSIGVKFTEQVTADACSTDSTDRVLLYLTAVPDGVQGYSRKLKGLVETSLNMGIVETASDHVKAGHLVRSSVESRKEEIKEKLSALAAGVMGNVCIRNEYPAWMYREDSRLRKIMVETYDKMYGKEPEIETIHAGLECGLLIGKKPELDCVSFGPDIFDAHSFHERLSIASTARCFEYLKKVLAKCK